MLKSFDYFRKIQTQQQLTSSTGGAFTIASLIFGAILIIMSLQDFYSVNYYTYLIVQNTNSTYLPIRIDLTLQKMPCQPIEIQFHDELQYLQQHLEKQLIMTHIAPNGTQIQYVRTTNIQTEKQTFLAAQKQNFSCRIKGITKIPMTPGVITIKPTNNRILDQSGIQTMKNARMNYKLKTLQFGYYNNSFDFPITHRSKNIENYVNMLQDNYNQRQVVLDFSNQTSQVSFYSHLKIIPINIQHSEEDVSKGQRFRYSMRSSKGPLSSPYPQIQLLTQIQPIQIVYKKQNPRFYDLLVKILAVVGGSMATIGILNSLSHFILSFK